MGTKRGLGNRRDCQAYLAAVAISVGAQVGGAVAVAEAGGVAGVALPVQSTIQVTAY